MNPRPRVVIVGRLSDDPPELDFTKPRTDVVRGPRDPFRADQPSWYPGAGEKTL
jgi:hypothetical protein